MSENTLNISNPELKAKLETLRLKESPDLQEQVYTEISNSAQFLSVVKFKEDSTPENPKYDFPVLTTAGHGYIFYPIFTDMEELRKWNQEDDVQVAVLTFDNYAEMVLQDSKIHGLVINPYSANFPIERDMVDYLKTQKAFFGKLAIEQMFHQAKNDGPAFSDPNPYPAEMIESMCEILSANDIIQRAWLRLMENEGETSYLVIIDAAGGDAESCYGDITSAAMPHLTDLYLDLVSYGDDFGKNAAESVEPFYCK